MITIDEILNIATPQEFDSVALRLFAFQAERCKPYADYIALLGIEPSEVRALEDIPFLPIELFKSHDIYCGDSEPEIVFTSSNTGGTVPSHHMMASTEDYRRTFIAAFEHFYGPIERWSI